MGLSEQEKQELQESFRRCRPGTLEAIYEYRDSGSASSLETVVYGIIDRYMPPESPMKIDDADDDTLLADDLGIDSLTMLEIVLSIEEALGVRVDDSELQSIRTLGEVKTYLSGKGSETGEGAEEVKHSRIYQRENIELMLPQQPPFLFLDSAEIDGEYVKAAYTPHEDETFFLGHFKDDPVLPASILFESMGQACCLYVLGNEEAREKFTSTGKIYFASMDGSQFYRKVVPGEKIQIEVKLKSLRAPLAIFSARAEVKGERVATVRELVLVFGDIADQENSEELS